MAKETTATSANARFFLMEKMLETFIPLRMTIDVSKKHLVLNYTCPLKSTTVGIELFHPVAFKYLQPQKNKSEDIVELVRHLPIDKGWCTSPEGTLHMYCSEKKLDLTIGAHKQTNAITEDVSNLLYDLHILLLTLLENHPNMRLSKL